MLLGLTLSQVIFRGRLVKCAMGLKPDFIRNYAHALPLQRYVIALPRVVQPLNNYPVWLTPAPAVQVTVNNCNGYNYGANAGKAQSNYGQSEGSNPNTPAAFDETDPVATIVPDDARTIVDDLLTSTHEENE